MPRPVSRVRGGVARTAARSPSPSADDNNNSNETELTEFYVVSRQQLESLKQKHQAETTKVLPPPQPPQNRDTTDIPGSAVPPLNKPIDDVLNQNNATATNDQEAICQYLENLPKGRNSLVQPMYTRDTMQLDLQRPLIVDNIPTKRPSGYYVRALGTPQHDEKDDIVFHDSVRVALALLETGMPYTYIQNTQILDQLQADNQTQQERAEQLIIRRNGGFRGYCMKDWRSSS